MTLCYPCQNSLGIQPHDVLPTSKQPGHVKLDIWTYYCTLQLGKYGGEHAPFQQMLDSMSRARFCITIPGDAASTRRLSEIYMAGEPSHGALHKS